MYVVLGLSILCLVTANTGFNVSISDDASFSIVGVHPDGTGTFFRIDSAQYMLQKNGKEYVTGIPYFIDPELFVEKSGTENGTDNIGPYTEHIYNFRMIDENTTSMVGKIRHYEQDQLLVFTQVFAESWRVNSTANNISSAFPSLIIGDIYDSDLNFYIQACGAMAGSAISKGSWGSKTCCETRCNGIEGGPTIIFSQADMVNDYPGETAVISAFTDFEIQSHSERRFFKSYGPGNDPKSREGLPKFYIFSF